jgi:hypothetical protein
LKKIKARIGSDDKSFDFLQRPFSSELKQGIESGEFVKVDKCYKVVENNGRAVYNMEVAPVVTMAYINYIKAAIFALKESGGSTKEAIKAFIVTTYPTFHFFQCLFLASLKQRVQSGEIVEVDKCSKLGVKTNKVLGKHNDPNFYTWEYTYRFKHI